MQKPLRLSRDADGQTAFQLYIGELWVDCSIGVYRSNSYTGHYSLIVLLDYVDLFQFV